MVWSGGDGGSALRLDAGIVKEGRVRSIECLKKVRG